MILSRKDLAARQQVPDFERALPTRLTDSVVEQCGCTRRINTTLLTGEDAPIRNSSTCSLHSLDRGPGQRAVAFSFYGNPDSKLGKERKYFQGIKDNLKLMPEHYPGWTLR